MIGFAECFTYLDEGSKMVSFELILTTLELSVIFWGSWSRNKNGLEPKTKSPLLNLACQNPQNAL